MKQFKTLILFELNEFNSSQHYNHSFIFLVFLVFRFHILKIERLGFFCHVSTLVKRI